MRISSIVAGILGLSLLAAPAMAQRGPTVQEAGEEELAAPIGLVQSPTAYTLPANRWLIGGGTFQQAVTARGGDDQFTAGIFRGLAENLHVGAFWTGVEVRRPDGRDVTESFFGGAAQWKFAEEGTYGGFSPALSIGGYAYTGPGNGGTAYLVASKNLMGEVRPGALFLHAGARWDTFDNSGIDDSGIVPFVGANLLLTRDLSLLAEWRDNQDWELDEVMAVGALYRLGPNLVISAGVQDPGVGDWKFFGGLSIIP
ncbi:MAG: hypothetical protein HY321_00505 [Armatimonadetes bacterium]|nr:hypothetical protein [Armatimonadota bacterium]